MEADPFCTAPLGRPAGAEQGEQAGQNRTDGFVKRAVCKAHEPWKGEAYFLYVEPLPGEVQHSRWTFYEAVFLDRLKSIHISKKPTAITSTSKSCCMAISP